MATELAVRPYNSMHHIYYYNENWYWADQKCLFVFSKAAENNTYISKDQHLL